MLAAKPGPMRSHRLRQDHADETWAAGARSAAPRSPGPPPRMPSCACIQAWSGSSASASTSKLLRGSRGPGTSLAECASLQKLAQARIRSSPSWQCSTSCTWASRSAACPPRSIARDVQRESVPKAAPNSLKLPSACRAKPGNASLRNGWSRAAGTTSHVDGINSKPIRPGGV
eukprot:6432789-Pyramimonas_sp.AAC.1